MLKVSESLSELKEMTAEALQGKRLQSVPSSGEFEFLAELSMFDLQESSEATLYKWAKFLFILNIILTF